MGADEVEGDIGKFGFGGSKAILWLFHHCVVWTLRKGKLAHDKVDWDAVFESNRYPEIEDKVFKPTSHNTPKDLLKLRHGTAIIGKVVAGKIVREENITRDLAIKFAPALAAGVEIFFNGQPLETAMPVFKTSVKVKAKVGALEAVGEVGICDDLPSDAVKIHLCYADRVITSTRDFFFNAKGEAVPATQVTGFIKLKGSWPLTTEKDEIADQVVYQSLRKQIIHQIQPILDMEEENKLSIAFADLALELSDLLLKGDLTVTRAVIDVPEFERKGGKRGPNKHKHTHPDQPLDPDGKPEPRRAAKLNFVFKSDKQMKGALVSFDGQDAAFVAWINKEHPYMVDTARNRKTILATVVGEFAAKINESVKIIDQLFSRSAAKRLKETEDWQLRRQRIHRALVDRMTNK
jgi:hypothetical protein